MISKQSLFEARTGGYHIYRIPSLLATPGGAVLASTAARRGGGGDWDRNDLLLRRSLDGGLTWAPARRLVDADRYGEGPVSNHVMIADQADGVVHGIYCWNYARVFHQVSRDDGATFSEPVEITGVLEALRRVYPWRVIATGPGHGTQLRNGRMIVPLWMSDGTGTEFGPGKLGHRPSCVALLYSDDHGRTWQCGDIVVPQAAVKNPSETVCVELAEGRVYFNVRSESEVHRRLTTVSPNGATGWSRPEFDSALLEPVCMASLIRYDWPAAGRPGRILFANPDNLERTMAKWACDRKRLTVKLSRDDARTWPVSRVLEDGPSGYSDLGVMPDGTVLCLYEAGSLAHMCDIGSLVLARFDLAWLEEQTQEASV
jgi:sialidase-1